MRNSQQLQQTFRYFPQEILTSQRQRQIQQQKYNPSIVSNSHSIISYEEDQLTKLQNMLIKKPTFEEMMLLEKQKKQLEKIIEIYKMQEIDSKKERQQLKQKLKAMQNQKENYRLKNKQLQIQVNKFDEIRQNIAQEYRTIKLTLLEMNKQFLQKQNQCEKLQQKIKQFQRYGELKNQNCQLKRIQSKQANQIQVLKKVILQLRSQIRDIKVQMFQQFVIDRSYRQSQTNFQKENISKLEQNKQNKDQNAYQTKLKIINTQNKIHFDKQKKNRNVSSKKRSKESQRTRATTIFK